VGRKRVEPDLNGADRRASDSPGESDSEIVFRGTLDYDHELTATTSLLDKLVVEAGADNTFVQNDIALR
jgi:putative salt-induced outer membrane protein YdiY